MGNVGWAGGALFRIPTKAEDTYGGAISSGRGLGDTEASSVLAMEEYPVGIFLCVELAVGAVLGPGRPWEFSDQVVVRVQGAQGCFVCGSAVSHARSPPSLPTSRLLFTKVSIWKLSATTCKGSSWFSPQLHASCISSSVYALGFRGRCCLALGFGSDVLH